MLITYECTCFNDVNCGVTYEVKMSSEYIEPDQCLWCGGHVETMVIDKEAN